ncbi:MAG TPA: hypothetical protein VKI64_01135, partial [Acidimicrobiales bacterium]|nr:hypothetical protein [Acidimicrobiales bacterium]
MRARAAALVALGALVLTGVAVGLALRSSSGPGRRGPSGVPFATQTRRYEVLYRVDHLAGGTQSRTWELLTVDRPFRVRDATFGSRPGSGDRPLGGTLTTPDRLYSLAPGGIQDVSARQPGLGTQDQDLLGIVAEGARRGLVQAGGSGSA